MEMILALAGIALVTAEFSYAVTVQQGSGANAAAIQATVDAFRADLGGSLNPNVASSFATGRREINWDGVPDNLSAPNNLPGNFFNVNSPRGVLFSTPGSGFQVSANAVNPTNTPVRFGNINAQFPGTFTVFSPQRLFTALDSNIVDVNFFYREVTRLRQSTGLDLSSRMSIYRTSLLFNILMPVTRRWERFSPPQLRRAYPSLAFQVLEKGCHVSGSLTEMVR